jgi:hypothetical protein
VFLLQTAFGFFVPPLTFGVAPLVGTLMCLFLPETANAKLPDTLEDGENFGSTYRVHLELEDIIFIHYIIGK